MKRLSPLTSVAVLALIALPMTALAAGGGHAAPEHVPFSVWFHAVNLTIMVGILYYFGRVPLRDYLAKRQDTVRVALKRAEQARIEAETRAAEYEQKLVELTAQAATQRERVERDAQEEVQQMIASAHRHAVQIKEQMDRLMEEELRSMRQQLRSESIAMALELAQTMVKNQINDADHERLLTTYVHDVNTSEVN